jgi:CubicO group peptidase (beta-lactamase class C family)
MLTSHPRVQRVLLALSLPLAAFASTPARNPSEPIDPRQLRTFTTQHITQALEEHGIPGAAVAIVHRGQTVIQKGFGIANLQTQEPVQASNTLFRVASISKILTTLAVLQQAQQGTLDLHRNVNHYLDRLHIPADFNQPVTLHHLLTHTAGFDVEFLKDATRLPGAREPLRDYLLLNQPRRLRPPGLFPTYDNYGFALAGYLLQRAVEKPFAVYVEDSLLAPLGMDNSTFMLDDHSRLQLARGYWNRGSHLEAYPPDQVNLPPAAGLSATAADMARLITALLGHPTPRNHAILPAELLTPLQQPQFEIDPAVPGRCYGFNQVLIAGRKVLRQTGRWPGYNSVLLLFPRHDLGLFLTYNLADRGNFRKQFTQAFTRTFVPRNSSAKTHSPSHNLSSSFDSLAGTYLTTRFPAHEPILGQPREIQITTSSQGLLVNGTPFVPISTNTFTQAAHPNTNTMPATAESLTFLSNTGSKPHYLITDRASYRRAQWWETRRAGRWIVAFALTALLSALLHWPPAALLRWLRHLSHPKPIHLSSALSRLLIITATLASLLLLTSLTATLLSQPPLNHLYGLPQPITKLLHWTPIIPAATAALTLTSIWVWTHSRWSILERSHFTLVTLALLLLSFELHQRNLLLAAY